jgi:hypothetical protein
MADWITTTTLIDGQYQAQRVDINTVLLQNKRPSTVPPLPEHEPVELGLLTQTIVQSPVVNWTLSARLGNAQDHDVVFIGVSSLSLCSSKRCVVQSLASDRFFFQFVRYMSVQCVIS